MSLKLILVGKTGEGKSSTGNALLGKNHFKTGGTANAVTTKCQLKEDKSMGFRIVDTPGLFDNITTLKERALEIQRSVDICSEPHAFLFIFELRRGSTDVYYTIDMMRIIFGEEFFDHCIVVFTHGCTPEFCSSKRSTGDVLRDDVTGGSDEYQEQSLDYEELRPFWSTNASLSYLIGRCKNRVVRIENNADAQCSVHTTKYQVSKIKSMVNSVSNNGNLVYSNRFLRSHREALEQHTNTYDSLVAQMVLFQKNYFEYLQRDKERMEQAQQNNSKTRKATLFGGLVGGSVGTCVGGSVAAVAIGKAGAIVVGSILGLPTGALAGGFVLYKAFKYFKSSKKQE